MKVSLYDRGDDPLIEWVAQLQYMGIIMKDTGSYCPEVQRNIRRLWSVCRSMGKLLQWEETYSQVSALFYRAAIQ